MKEENGKRNKVTRRKEDKVFKITLWPNFMLTIFGFFASWFGEGSCESTFYKFKSRLQEIEEAEVLHTERLLQDSRKRVIYLLTSLDDRNQEKAIDDPVLTARRKRGYLCKLAEIDEFINLKNAELDQRILKSRDCAESKVSAYLTGIRRGRFRSYEYPEPLVGDDHARETYNSRFAGLNTRLARFLERSDLA